MKRTEDYTETISLQLFVMKKLVFTCWKNQTYIHAFGYSCLHHGHCCFDIPVVKIKTIDNWCPPVLWHFQSVHFIFENFFICSLEYLLHRYQYALLFDMNVILCGFKQCLSVIRGCLYWLGNQRYGIKMMYTMLTSSLYLQISTRIYFVDYIYHLVDTCSFFYVNYLMIMSTSMGRNQCIASRRFWKMVKMASSCHMGWKWALPNSWDSTIPGGLLDLFSSCRPV